MAAACVALAASACGTAAPRAAEAPVTSTVEPPATARTAATATPTTAAAAVTTTSTAAAVTTAAPRTAPPTSPPTPSTAPATTAPIPAEDPHLALAGGAGQAIVVTAAAYGATTATLVASERAGTGWRTVFGPWTVHLGTAGLAPPGEKREGDGRTPSGVYGFDFFFGVSPDPGVRFPYRPVAGPNIVWDDDPASPLYNEWVDVDAQPAGARPEPMYVTPAYSYGAVIAYNAARTPGLGSAIFLHVSTGGPTAGCVSLPVDQLLQVLRWLDPTQGPRIVLGVA
jgi:L,D-peptidoglycan transpeptidase YkuD (ErfK/YbiS/YcfS/YnhG family)